MYLVKNIVGADAHIGPLKNTDIAGYTGVDVGIDPYDRFFCLQLEGIREE